LDRKKKKRTDRRLACRLRLGKSSLFTQLKMTDRCCNTPFVKYYSLVDKKIKQPMNEFFFVFSLQVNFPFFFSSSLLSNRRKRSLSLISYLSLITHGNEQQQRTEGEKKERRRKKKLFPSTYTFFFFFS
jgi:hypothetical protein